MFSRDRCRHACMHLFIVKKNTQHLFPAARLAARLTEETMCAPAPPRAIFKSCRRSPLHAIPFAMFLKPTPMQERTKVMDRSSALILYTAHTHTHTHLRRLHLLVNEQSQKADALILYTAHPRQSVIAPPPPPPPSGAPSCLSMTTHTQQILEIQCLPSRHCGNTRQATRATYLDAALSPERKGWGERELPPPLTHTYRLRRYRGVIGAI